MKKTTKHEAVSEEKYSNSQFFKAKDKKSEDEPPPLLLIKEQSNSSTTSLLKKWAVFEQNQNLRSTNHPHSYSKP